MSKNIALIGHMGSGKTLIGKLIAKKSNVRLVILKTEVDLLNYFKKNLFDNELVVCMGAGSISTWIRNISQKL